ncbi:HD domain-containing protein [Thomasclavelia ramosa]|uniref:HD domain-containing protein n=1 Tax=Thomasclavelia ramosa TaxID=1547 RepID=UPI001F3ADF0F|nr:HD domain-containing protein [Thomasclavelia ramosa]
MEPRELLNALAIVEMLKDTTRHCYTSKGRHESVTEHSWMMTVMAFLMINEFPEANMNKVIQMCIIHDLGECFTGDIPVFMKNKENENVEERLLNEWVESLPKVTRNLMKESIWKRRKDRLLNQKYIRQ